MTTLDESTKREVRQLVYEFFADECDVDVEEISDETNIIEELEGDSLMMLSLLGKVCKKYGITVKLRVLGKHLMKHPADTIGEVVYVTNLLVEHGDGIVDVEL